VKSGKLFLGILLVLAAISTAGCKSRAGSLSFKAQHGKNVYDAQCAMCHEATNLHLIKDPPRLDAMFKKPALPSGAPATDDEVRNVILHGRGIMPPFEQAVGGDNLDDLMEYLRTR
jgi:mono/diheme cytochrome c family protein